MIIILTSFFFFLVHIIVLSFCLCVFLVHLRVLTSNSLQFTCFVQVACHNGTIETSCKFSIQTLFFLVIIIRVSMVSSSTSHAPPPALSIVVKPSNPNVHEPPTKKPKKSYMTSFEFSKILGQNQF
jgi:hypothetical protein